MCGANPCDKPNCTWSEAWKKECWLRHIAKQPADWRANHYADFEKKHGKPATAELKRKVGEAWKKSQQPSLL